MKNPTFWIRLFIGGAVFLTLASHLQAQNAPINFDALPRGAKPAAAAPIVVKTTKPAAVKSKVDTVHTVDTVRVTVVRVDTVKAAPASAVAPVAKAAAPAAVSFAPPSIAGLFQFQATGGDSTLRSTYRVRRAEVKVVSDLGHKAQAVLMVDIAKALSLTTAGPTTSVTQSSRVLQDAYVSLPVWNAQVEAGQQRLPLSLEGSVSSSTLETIDRALMASDRARGGSFGDVRDLGVAARGTWSVMDYRAGLFNGSGETMNETDKNPGKAFVAQLGVRPAFAPGLRIGVSGATSGAAAGDKPARDRLGVDVRFNANRLLVQAEAMHGQDGTTQRFGGYALAGVNVTSSVKIVGRFDAWDPDLSRETAAASVTERDFLGGITWVPAGTRLKAQFAVVRKTYTRDVVPAVRQVLTQIQASW
ncbi:MAG TPA: porin [Gemmatimonadaceae bacterium]